MAAPPQPLAPESLPMSNKLEAERGSNLENLLLYFGRTPLEQVAPRPTTGTVKLWKECDIVGVQDSERLPRVFNKLVVEGFLSVPVLDVNRKFKAMLDMLDIVMFTCDLFASMHKEWTDENWAAFAEKEQKFTEATVQEVLDHPRNKKPNVIPVYAGVSVLQSLVLFANPAIHRIPVVSKDMRIVGMSTQSMIVSLFTQNLGLMGPIAQAKVSEIAPLLKSEVTCIKASQPAIEAFQLMAQQNVSGVGVVNNDGLLVDTISIRDLRGIGTNAARWKSLYMPVSEFRLQLKSEFPNQTPSEVLCVTKDDTFQRVIELMDDGNIQRVFEVEEKAGGKLPARIITLGDAIKFFCERSGIKSLEGKAGESGSGAQAAEQQQSPQSQLQEGPGGKGTVPKTEAFVGSGLASPARQQPASDVEI